MIDGGNDIDSLYGGDGDDVPSDDSVANMFDGGARVNVYVDARATVVTATATNVGIDSAPHIVPIAGQDVHTGGSGREQN